MPLIASRLRELREAAGYSQEQLAKKLDLGIRQIFRYESEIGQPAIDALAKIAVELGTSMEYMMGITDNSGPCITAEDQMDATEWKLLRAFRSGNLSELIQIIAAQPFSQSESDFNQ
jgi:transcriptional regulator with XRE-family HTH domain